MKEGMCVYILMPLILYIGTRRKWLFRLTVILRFSVANDTNLALYKSPMNFDVSHLFYFVRSWEKRKDKVCVLHHLHRTVCILPSYFRVSILALCFSEHHQVKRQRTLLLNQLIPRRSLLLIDQCTENIQSHASVLVAHNRLSVAYRRKMEFSYGFCVVSCF